MDEEKVKHDVVLVCKNCGAERKARGHFTKHKSGTITFHAYNLEADCIYCSPKYAKYRK